MEDTGLIYIFTSPSGKRYVGQTLGKLQNRIWKHESDARMARGAVFQKAIRRYGIPGFSIVTIMGVPVRLLDEWERFFIRELNTIFPHGYNMDGGGSDKVNLSEASRAKMRAAHVGKSSWNRGIPNTEVQKQKICIALRGRFISEKTREACRETGKRNKGRNLNGHFPWNKGKTGLQISHNKGKHLSEETKRKLSIARKGKYSGEKHPLFGKHHSEDSKRKMSLARSTYYQARRMVS